MLPQGTSGGTLATLANGLTVTGDCISPPAVGVAVKTSSKSETLELFGHRVNGTETFFVEDFNATGYGVSDKSNVGLEGIARDANVGKFAHIVVSGRVGSPCTYWGMIIPSG